VHSCSRHGVVAARFPSERTGRVIPFSKTFTVLSCDIHHLHHLITFTVLRVHSELQHRWTFLERIYNALWCLRSASRLTWAPARLTPPPPGSQQAGHCCRLYGERWMPADGAVAAYWKRPTLFRHLHVPFTHISPRHSQTQNIPFYAIVRSVPVAWPPVVVTWGVTELPALSHLHTCNSKQVTLQAARPVIWNLSTSHLTPIPFCATLRRPPLARSHCRSTIVNICFKECTVLNIST
jgi:hypothetical protein